MVIILGAGLSGLAIADHFQRTGIAFRIVEAKAHSGGHIYSENVNGFIWDEGPHVSFAKSPYVRQYLAENCDNEFLEFAAEPSNYYKGNRIPHPAQTNLYAVPAPLRNEILDEIKTIRNSKPADFVPANYAEWLQYAFGPAFSKTFPEVYTRKYWTTAAENLATDWIGNRVYFPDVQEMRDSAAKPLQKHTHYLSTVRYPKQGGFYSFIKKVSDALPVELNKEAVRISFAERKLFFSDGETVTYDRLISTIPLTALIAKSDAPQEIRWAAERLRCSRLLLVNVVASHTALTNNEWLYVYDEEMYSTRINFTELLSPQNGTKGKTGIQVEVYFSEYNLQNESDEAIAAKVIGELVTMKLLRNRGAAESYHIKRIPFANVIFDLQREAAQSAVLTWLEGQGLIREDDDLEPMTNWDVKAGKPQALGSLVLAGRFAQWKYYWTEDCVLRAQFICKNAVHE